MIKIYAFIRPTFHLYHFLCRVANLRQLGRVVLPLPAQLTQPASTGACARKGTGASMR
jgi:hypothetical protein